jgi:hypothetical protein
MSRIARLVFGGAWIRAEPTPKKKEHFFRWLLYVSQLRPEQRTKIVLVMVHARRIPLSLLLGSLVLSGAALAQGVRNKTRGVTPAEEQAALQQRAQESHERGRKAYLAGELAQAIEHYMRALAIKVTPRLHFDLGLAYEKQGQWAEALEAFRAYLQAEPRAKNAEDVQRRIRYLHVQTSSSSSTTARSNPTPKRPVAGWSRRVAEEKTGPKDPGTYQPFNRSGLTLGGSAGLALSTCAADSEGDVPTASGLVVARLGYFVSREIAILGQVTLTLQRVPELSTANAEKTTSAGFTLSGFVAPGLHYFVADFVWLSGWLGFAFDTLPPRLKDGAATRTAIGPGVGLGGGWEFWRFGRFALSLEGLVTLHVPVQETAGRVQLRRSLHIGAGIGLQYY